MKITFLVLGLIAFMAICNSACTPDTPDFELGRYEYAGIDNKTFRFCRVESGGTFREVSAKKTGIGEILALPFCDKKRFGTWFYDCGLFPDLEKPYYDFKEDRVESICHTPAQGLCFASLSYKIIGDSLLIGVPDGWKIPRLTGSKKREITLNWRIFQTTKTYLSAVEQIYVSRTEKEHLTAIYQQDKLKIGDTIALCLLKEKFVKK